MAGALAAYIDLSQQTLKPADYIHATNLNSVKNVLRVHERSNCGKGRHVSKSLIQFNTYLC